MYICRVYYTKRDIKNSGGKFLRRVTVPSLEYCDEIDSKEHQNVQCVSIFLFFVRRICLLFRICNNTFCNMICVSTPTQVLLLGHMALPESSRPALLRPDPKRSTRGNRCVPLCGTQFPKLHSRTHKAYDILSLII